MRDGAQRSFVTEDIQDRRAALKGKFVKSRETDYASYFHLWDLCCHIPNIHSHVPDEPRSGFDTILKSVPIHPVPPPNSSARDSRASRDLYIVKERHIPTYYGHRCPTPISTEPRHGGCKACCLAIFFGGGGVTMRRGDTDVAFDENLRSRSDRREKLTVEWTLAGFWALQGRLIGDDVLGCGMMAGFAIVVSSDSSVLW